MRTESGSKHRVTMRDVAYEAGVSAKTVSRVLNGEPGVTPETAERVVAAIARLGYRPNELARGLKGGRTRTIGLIIADVANPFFADCCKAIEQAVSGRDHALILCASAENPETERAYVDLLSRRRIDGLLIAPAPNDRGYLGREVSAGLPVVAFDRPVGDVETDTVIVSNREGAREATRHLIGHGRRRVAFIGDDERIHTANKRLAGYKQAMEEVGLEPVYRMKSNTVSTARVATAGLLEQHPDIDAFLGGNSLITAGILHAVENAGMSIPMSISLIGFDDFELLSILRPDLTVVRQPTKQLGRTAAEILLGRLDGSVSGGSRREVLHTELVLRGSCGCSSFTFSNL